MLTGKCKEDFDKWLPKVHQVIAAGINGDFHSLHQSLTYGVYMDFFDTVGLEIRRNFGKEYSIQSKNRKYECENGFLLHIDNLNRKSVVKKANQVYNKSN